jgi:hypothetical protein
MGKAVKRLFFLGVFAGIGYAVWRAVQASMRAPSDELAWETAPFPFPPVPRPPGAVGAVEVAPTETAVAESASDAPPEGGAWVEPADGTCPATHPVKAKLSSGIFHVPGGQNYDRTHADRCYVDADAAAADGLRQSQR